MLGILDSGLGGLTVLQRVRAHFPEEDLVYFADQANSPLGIRASTELTRLFQHYVDELHDLGVEGIVMGSNTLCAIAREHGWPSATVPIVDLIEPVAHAVAASGTRNVGVLATSATVQSGVYGNVIHAAMPGVNVQEVAASDLVSLVEAGCIGGEPVIASLRDAKEKFGNRIDLLVLGCTHFSWLHDAISEVFGADVSLLDPADSVIHEIKAVREKLPGGKQRESNRQGSTRFMTTGDAYFFERCIEKLIGPLDIGATVIHIDAGRFSV